MNKKKLWKLAGRAARGDKRAFGKLCECKVRDIIYITTKIMKNRQDGEDAAQEVLLYMQNHIRELKHPEAFNVWLYRIINGICMNMIKKNKKVIAKDLTAVTSEAGCEETFESEYIAEDREEFLPHDFAESADKRKAVFEVLDQLPDRYRMCIYMYYFEEMNYKEISEALDISAKDVDNALARGKKSIKRQLEKNPDLKKFLTKTYGAVPVPVLTRIMKGELTETVSEEGAARILAATVGAGTRRWLSGTAIKWLIGGLAVIGTIAGLFWYGRNGMDESRESGQTIEEDAAEEARTQPVHRKGEQPAADNQSDKDGNAAVESFVIRTLEDMIGEAEAGQLRGLVQSEAVEINQALSFLESIGMEVYEGIYNPFSKWEYTLFTLRKQDKLLMVILEQKSILDSTGLIFRFTSAEEQMPANIDIMLKYFRWKENNETGE